MRDLIVESSDSSMGYESDDKMEMDELKQVSFSPDVEVREFNRLPRQLDSSDYEPIMGLKHDGIKARLGRTLQTPPSKKNLHTVKTVAMKPVKPSQSVASRVGKMKSDNMTAQTNSIHSRLTITSRSRDTVTKMDTRVSKPKGSSVFNRLGRNKWTEASLTKLSFFIILPFTWFLTLRFSVDFNFRCAKWFHLKKI